MAFITLNLGLKPEYKALVDDFLKFTFFILILHSLLSLSKGKSPTQLGLMGDLFNNDFLTLFVFGIISLYVYHMIAKRLIEIN